MALLIVAGTLRVEIHRQEILFVRQTPHGLQARKLKTTAVRGRVDDMNFVGRQRIQYRLPVGSQMRREYATRRPSVRSAAVSRSVRRRCCATRSGRSRCARRRRQATAKVRQSRCRTFYCLDSAAPRQAYTSVSPNSYVNTHGVCSNRISTHP